MRKYRTEEQILADILEVMVKRMGKARYTHIMRGANLGNKFFRIYTQKLKNEQLILEKQQGKYSTFSATALGLMWLKKYQYKIREENKNVNETGFYS